MQLYNIALHIAVLYTGRGVDTGVVTVLAVFALLWLQPVCAVDTVCGCNLYCSHCCVVATCGVCCAVCGDTALFGVVAICVVWC